MRLLKVPFALLCAYLTPAYAQTAEKFFDDSQIQEIQLQVEAADWAALRANYLEDTYYKADLTWNGMTLSIGIRSRGSGSRSPEKPNLHFKMDKYKKGQTFFGLTTVTFKANNQEASMLRERLSMKFYRRMGIPAPREAACRLVINGEYFGLYTIVEAIDDHFLARNLGESAGYLYEWNWTRDYHFEYLGDDPALYSPDMWEPKDHDNDPDPQPIVELVRAINLSPDEQFESAVSRYLNVKQFLAYVAVENFLGDIDGVLGGVQGMNNFYFYRFASGGVSELIPWDKDLTFRVADHPLLDHFEENVLTRRAMSIPSLRNSYLSAAERAALVAGGADGWLLREFDREYAQVRDLARNDPHKQCIRDAGVMEACGPEDFEREAAVVRNYIQARAAFTMNALASLGPGSTQQAPAITTVSTAGIGLDNPVGRGSLMSIYGANLSVSRLAWEDYPLKYEMGETSVTLDGMRLPLLYVSPSQVNVQIPWDADLGESAIVVNAAGVLSAPALREVGDVSPGILLVTHASGNAPVTLDSPAAPSEALILYATGLGASGRTIPKGEPGGEPAAQCSETPAVDLAAIRVADTTCDLDPGLVGVYRVRFAVPASTAAGTSVPLKLTVGTLSISTDIAVR